MVALQDDLGNPLKSKTTPVADLKAAHRRIVASGPPAANEVANGTTVIDVCDAYLAKVEGDGATKTYNDRADTLFDFCHGLPPRFRSGRGKPQEKPEPADYIHKGFADVAVASLLPLHVDQWLNAHPTWKGGRRSRVQALKRALNYGVECGLIPASPLRGYKIPKQAARVTYLTPEQEKALHDAANPSMQMAMKVCIRTGARPGCEFAAMTAQHVKDHGERMELVFQPNESKTKRLRVIRITDPEIVAIIRERVAKHPKGAVFRNTRGDEWKRESLSLAFRKLKAKLIKKGVEFDKDACMYSCRHTYAKRILQGYWTGKQTNIETLARLMGNSPQVCRDHYLQWTDTYNEPLWESA
jgi:integrase